MKYWPKKWMLLFCLSFSLIGWSQQFSELTDLSPLLSESSGLLYLSGKIITHNDSQGEAALFELDSLNGSITRTVTIANADNIDWEDLAVDANFIYIGDFGNNDGSRLDLKIFRVLITDYFNTPNDTIYCDTILFSYGDQTNFNPQPQATNYDCEAMTTIGDSLYLFTKNWVNAKTYVYPISKLPGTYSAVKTDSIMVQGWITGADYIPNSDRLILSGYTQFPFVVEMNNPLGGPFHQNTFVRYNLGNTQLLQTEAIASYVENEYFLTSEAFQSTPAKLYRLVGLQGSAELKETYKTPFYLYPNPVKDAFTIELSSELLNAKINIYTINGDEVELHSSFIKGKIQVNANFSPGTYWLKLKTDSFEYHHPFIVH